MSSMWQEASAFHRQACLGIARGAGGGGKEGDQEVQALPRIDTDPSAVGSANPCCLPFIGNDSESIAWRWAVTGVEG